MDDIWMMMKGDIYRSMQKIMMKWNRRFMWLNFDGMDDDHDDDDVDKDNGDDDNYHNGDDVMLQGTACSMQTTSSPSAGTVSAGTPSTLPSLKEEA